MPRITPIDPTTATGATADHLETCRRMLGATPNVFLTAARSPAALASLVASLAALAKSTLGARTGELLAIAIAEANGCSYCLSAHTAIGGSLGLAPEALARARRALGDDPRTAALLTLAVAVNAERGRVSDATLAAARAAGITDDQIVEVVAHVALNTFTNYLNNLARTAIDFPVVESAAAA